MTVPTEQTTISTVSTETNYYILQDYARLGEYNRLENLSDSELLQPDEYDKSLYYYLVFSRKRDAIIWLLNKNIIPPDNVIRVANNYERAFRQK
jgi:hypothetical protein